MFENVGPVGKLTLALVLPLEDVLKDRFLGVEELAGLAVELPQDARLADVERQLAAADIDEHALKDLIQIERFAGHVLEVPGELAGVGFERQRRTGVERGVGAGGAAARLHPRLGLRHAPIGEIEIRIVTSRDPGIAAGAQHVGELAPAVATRRAFTRRCYEAPELLSGLRVVAADEAALVLLRGLVQFAAAKTLDDFAVDDDRAAGIGEALGVVGDDGVPNHPAGPGVERHDVRIRGGDVDLVLIDRQIAHRAVPAAPRA